MNFVVAGAVFLLALLIALISYAAIPRFTYESDELSTDDSVKRDAVPAPTLTDIFLRHTAKQWLFFLFVSLLCAVSAYLLSAGGFILLDLCRATVVSLTLMSAMIIDRKTHRIPNILVCIALGAGAILLLLEFLFYRETFVNSLVTYVVGLICCVVLFYVLARLTKNGIGMGDVKLVAAMGWLLGLSLTLFSVLFALLVCSAAALFLLIGKKKNSHDRIPFGPFLFFGHILMLLLFSI